MFRPGLRWRGKGKVTAARILYTHNLFITITYTSRYCWDTHNILSHTKSYDVLSVVVVVLVMRYSYADVPVVLLLRFVVRTSNGCGYVLQIVGDFDETFY